MNKTHLPSEQRYTISLLLRQCYKQKDIASSVGKDKSFVSRGIKRNKNLNTGKYSHTYANEMASICKERFRQPKELTFWLKCLIISLLKERLSPEQISGRLKLEVEASISYETIYKMIRAYKKEGGVLYLYCRHHLKKRKRNVSKSPAILNKKSIEQRPEIVNNYWRPADCEMDLIISKNQNRAILVFVERKYNYCIIIRLQYGKNASELAKAAKKDCRNTRNLFTRLLD